MDFRGQYLTYGEYQSLGGTSSQTPFNISEYNARKKIDERTFGRLQNLSTQPQEVKLCVFELIKIIESYSTNEGQNKSISSENTDGYSISYTSPDKSITEAKNSELEDVINTYLANVLVNNVPVLYRGAR